MTSTPPTEPDAVATRPDPASFAIGLGFAVIVSVHLVALGFDERTTMVITKIAIVPFAAAFLWVAAKGVRPRLFWLMLTGLGFSWLGDVVPEFLDDGFLVMVGFFACAQVAYIAAFWPSRGQSLLRKPILLAPYVIAAIVVIALCAPHAGVLFVPVIAYAVVLMASAVLSTGLGVVAGIGGALFLISDAMIAIREFPDWGWTQHLDVPVMATYALAQALLVIGAASALKRDAAGES